MSCKLSLHDVIYGDIASLYDVRNGEAARSQLLTSQRADYKAKLVHVETEPCTRFNEYRSKSFNCKVTASNN
ncbi:hypothetical protein Pmani_031645 [Petrolisthes manimaculis]|uniref:Uncharacterized protein n=1 Tax=Petrolisthes manimaculis TaxID=1843537 RepID=A0AAE1NT87_9EUCA|nr:hypothetical protein Pmani_031645 [Petrolisthes manimaculis]